MKTICLTATTVKRQRPYIKTILPVFLLFIAALTLKADSDQATPPEEAPAPIQFTYTERQKLDWSTEKTLQVIGIEGSIFVRPGADDGIELSCNKTAFAPDLAAARREAARIRIGIEAPADRIVVKAMLPPDWSAELTGRADCEFRVPRTIPLKLDTTGGDIDVDAVDGPISAATVSGDVILSDSDGPVTVQTASGDIELYDCPETLQAISESGEITFETGSLTAPVMAVESESGDISVLLPVGVDAEITLETATGAVDTAEASFDSISEEDNKFTLKSGKGSSRIRVRTTRGKITISSEE